MADTTTEQGKQAHQNRGHIRTAGQSEAEPEQKPSQTRTRSSATRSPKFVQPKPEVRTTELQSSYNRTSEVGPPRLQVRRAELSTSAPSRTSRSPNFANRGSNRARFSRIALYLKSTEARPGLGRREENIINAPTNSPAKISVPADALATIPRIGEFVEKIKAGLGTSDVTKDSIFFYRSAFELAGVDFDSLSPDAVVRVTNVGYAISDEYREAARVARGAKRTADAAVAKAKRAKEKSDRDAADIAALEARIAKRKAEAGL